MRNLYTIDHISRDNFFVLTKYFYLGISVFNPQCHVTKIRPITDSYLDHRFLSQLHRYFKDVRSCVLYQFEEWIEHKMKKVLRNFEKSPNLEKNLGKMKNNLVELASSLGTSKNTNFGRVSNRPITI